jgi:S1-C subfamily serine protease
MVSGIAIKEWIKEHPSRDLAKVQAPASSESPAVGEIPDAPVLPVATSPFTETAKTLSWVMTMGFPLGFTELYTDLGRVNSNTLSSCQATDNECLRTQLDFSTTNDTDRGSSGSPLMDLDGRVIGVVSAGTNGQNVNFTYAIDASLVSGF